MQFARDLCDSAAMRLRERLAILLCLAAAAGCDGKPSAPATTTAAETGPTAREVIDASEAIEKFMNAGRMREAELVARKLLERAPAGSSAYATANEMMARALFARTQVPDEPMTRSERRALIAEAATCADRAASAGADAGAPDAAKLGFAALLASSAGNTERAKQLFDQAVAIAPNDAGNLMQAALAAIGRADLARAKELIAMRKLAAPGEAWNAGLDAEIALAESHFDASVDAARAAVAADRERLEFRLLLARTLRKAGRAAEAARGLSALEPAERAKPAIAEQFALALAESGDLRAAAFAWDEARRANLNDPYVRAQSALAFHRAGDTARAAAELAALDAIKGGAEERARIEALLRAEPAAK